MNYRLKKLIIDMLDDVYREAEKAHPELPSSFEEIAETGVGYIPNWYEWYYLDFERSHHILRRYMNRRRGYTKKALAWNWFFYVPTSNREKFEKWKQELSKFKTLDEIIQHYKKVEKLILDRRGA